MKPVRMNKADLLGKLRENRAKHKADFEAASDEYRKQALKETRALTKRIKQASRDELQNVSLYVVLTQPKQYVREYDCAIAMFENTLDDEIELLQREFTQYVLDQWDWSNEFVGSTALYNSAAAKLRRK